MTCHSEGTLELFIEPVTPVPRLVVVGDSTLSRTLVRLASELTYDVTAVADADAFAGADRIVAPADAGDSTFDGASFVVCASMDDSTDALGVECAVRAGVPYVSLVASPTRAETLYERAAERLDVDVAVVADAVKSPAGLDIGAKTPEEIAVSVLAELVAIRRAGDETPDVDGDEAVDEADEPSADEPETAVDPVCGMDVTVGDAAATVTFEGETYHFCGQGCADAFEEDPGRYLGAGEVA